MDFLQNVKMNNVIPAHATIAEGALYVIENGEMEFHNMMKNIGLNELAVAESTGIVITNEASVKAVVDQVIAWLIKKWEAVKGLFEKALKIITDKIAEFKSKIDAKLLEKAKAKAKTIKENDKDGKVKIYGKTYEYTRIEAVLNMSDPIWAAVNEFNELSHGIVDSYKASNDTETSANVAKNAAANAKQKLMAKIAEVCGVSADDISNDSALITVIANYIRGNEVNVDKKYINDNIDEMFAMATDKNKAVKGIKKVYNDTKKAYNNDIAFLKKDKKNVPSEVYMSCTKVMKESKMVSTAIVGAILANVKAKVSTDIRIIMKLVLASKEKPVKESAVLESSSYQTELVSLFDF